MNHIALPMTLPYKDSIHDHLLQRRFRRVKALPYHVREGLTVGQRKVRSEVLLEFTNEFFLFQQALDSSGC